MKDKFLIIFFLIFLLLPGCAVRLPSLPAIPRLPKVFDRVPFIPDHWISGYIIDTTFYEPPKLLDPIPPFLWLTYPENGDTLTKLHPVAGLAIDDGGIDSVILHLDSFLIKKQVLIFVFFEKKKGQVRVPIVNPIRIYNRNPYQNPNFFKSM